MTFNNVTVTVRWRVALEWDRVGRSYAVHVPGLPGINSQGRTKAEALMNIADAIHEYLLALHHATR
jgi:predicted RNase H-like HicB family nuclease